MPFCLLGGRLRSSLARSAASNTLHLTPYTLRPTPYALHSCTLHPAPYSPHPAPYTLRPAPSTPYPEPEAALFLPFSLSGSLSLPPSRVCLSLALHLSPAIPHSLSLSFLLPLFFARSLPVKGVSMRVKVDSRRLRWTCTRRKEAEVLASQASRDLSVIRAVSRCRDLSVIGAISRC